MDYKIQDGHLFTADGKERLLTQSEQQEALLGGDDISCKRMLKDSLRGMSPGRSVISGPPTPPRPVSE